MPGFVLDTPAQINMWVLLSRRSQCHLHLLGYKVPGLLKSMHHAGFIAGTSKTVKAALVDLNETIAANGGPPDAKTSASEQLAAATAAALWD